ncbi:MAG: hypothetical protein V3U72_00070, partial [Candidatus Aenigmarchaeota archaeon]
LKLGGEILAGSVALTTICAPFVFTPRIDRRAQKNIANQWKLSELYELPLEDLALTRVEKIHKMVSSPQKRNVYSKEKILPSLEKYLPQITEQSDTFKNNPTDTKAFKEFLTEETTRNWLTDPMYVISDKKHKRATSYIAKIIRAYAGLYTGGRDYVLKRQRTPQQIAKLEITS